jgi:hypothetical protein
LPLPATAETLINPAVTPIRVDVMSPFFMEKSPCLEYCAVIERLVDAMRKNPHLAALESLVRAT